MLETVKDATSIARFQIVSLPLRIAFKALPPQGPPSILHADVIKVPKELIPGQSIDIDDSLSDQNDVLQVCGV